MLTSLYILASMVPKEEWEPDKVPCTSAAIHSHLVQVYNGGLLVNKYARVEEMLDSRLKFCSRIRISVWTSCSGVAGVCSDSFAGPSGLRFAPSHRVIGLVHPSVCLAH